MHATAGTFAFKRELLKQTRYDDNAELAKEKHFKKLSNSFNTIKSYESNISLRISITHLIKESY